jgi:hypothetical protein
MIEGTICLTLTGVLIRALFIEPMFAYTNLKFSGEIELKIGDARLFGHNRVIKLRKK